MTQQQVKGDFPTLMNMAADLVQSGQIDAAYSLYSQLLPHAPNNVSLLSNIAYVAFVRGRVDESIDFYRRAIAADPTFIDAYRNYGVVLQKTGRLREAEEQFTAALKVNPNSYELNNGMGGVLRDMRRFDAALEYYSRAVTIKPTADGYMHIGYVCQLKNMPAEAGGAYETALEMDPRHVGAMNNLGTLYSDAHHFFKAMELFERTLAVDPNNAMALNNLGRLYKATGDMPKALESYRRAMTLQPKRAAVHHNYLFAMVYAAEISPEELMTASCDFGRLVADPLMRKEPFDRVIDPDRRLRIGYVSGDFRWHSASYFIEPLIRHHDREHFEIYAYSSTGKPDHVTERLKQEFDHWRDVFSLPDETIAKMIDSDKIDILIDCSGHTEGNCLMAFARKPAPVQVEWLGYPATTGMKAMDYRITDIHAEPPGMTEQFNVEKLWRLPDIFCCYNGSAQKPKVIDHPPFEDNGYITFGCFNNFSKVTDEVLDTWAEVMRQVPDARLLLEVAGIGDERYRRQMEERLAAHGLPMDRIILELRRPENQYVLYNRIDIAIDPFPCNGGTTSMDTMWMGVPMVTLAGRHFVSRMGVSILTNAGLPQLITHTQEEYIEKIVSLAHDRDELRRLRTGLHEKVEASPLMDQKAFARSMEAAYRGMWHEWCEQQKA